MPTLATLKLTGVALLAIFYTFGVWQIHTWYDGNKETKAAIIAEQKAQKGQTQLVDYQQKVRTIYVKTKDACINTPMPDDVRGLLSNPTAKLSKTP